MIRKLLIAAALLLFPCIGHTADPSADLSVKKGFAVACDNGDALGTPAMAAAAGFSHCVLNADFTKIGGFFGNIANFIDGCGGTGTKIFQAYYAYSGVQVPCNRMNIESDSGTQVLHLRYQRGDSSSTGTIRPLEFAYPTLKHKGAVQSGWPQPASPGTASLPQEMYTEITFRIPKASLDQGQLGRDIPFAWWQMGAAGGGPQGVEIDYIEINSDSNRGNGWNNSTGMREWGCDNCGLPHPEIVTHTDYTHYHKFGVLVTSDEKTNFAKCLFMDDVLQGCQTISPSIAIAYRTDRSKFLNYDVVWVGNNGGDAGPDFEPIIPVDVYIKSLTIWECPSYATTNCPASSYFDKEGLTFWRNTHPAQSRGRKVESTKSGNNRNWFRRSPAIEAGQKRTPGSKSG
jgi:hypothetical protein